MSARDVLTPEEFDALFPQGWLDDQVKATVESMKDWPEELRPTTGEATS
jgi:hypothetical protein